MADAKKMTLEEVNAYMKEKCGFVPRMFQIINTVTPDPGRTFADFYATIFGDGALSKKVKELMFMAGGVAYCSPRCIIHAIPAYQCRRHHGEEVFEAASVGMIFAGFVPGGPVFPMPSSMPSSALKLQRSSARARSGNICRSPSSITAYSNNRGWGSVSKAPPFFIIHSIKQRTGLRQRLHRSARNRQDILGLRVCGENKVVCKRRTNVSIQP